MKKAAIRYAEILEAGAWVTHQEQEEIAKLLRKLAMTEDEAWDELERKQAKKWNASDMAYRPNGLTIGDDIQEYKKPWVGLTDEEISNCWINPVASGTFTKRNVYEAIEAKLKEKNT
jgi:hypothetical protein